MTALLRGETDLGSTTIRERLGTHTWPGHRSFEKTSLRLDEQVDDSADVICECTGT